jgi:hypothetical protein
MGNAAQLLRIHILGAVVYVVLFYLMTSFTGLIGPGLASVLTSLMTFSLTARLMTRRDSSSGGTSGMKKRTA